MSRWFRYYDDALDDPKVQRLSSDLFRTWVNLLCLASKSDGKLPSVDDVAFKLRISVQDAQQRLEDLILAGLIDILPDKSLSPHNWSGRQFVSDSSALRVQKHRAKKRSEKNAKAACNVTGNAGNEKSNAIDSETYTDSEEDSLAHSNLSVAAREPKADGVEIRPHASSVTKPKRSDEQRFDSGFGKDEGTKGGGGLDTLVRRAEGLGLPVEDLIDVVNRTKPGNRPAYFTKLCVNRLQSAFPKLGETVIREALWGSDHAYGLICNVLVAAEAA
jgi:hypothetical protein